MTADGARWYIVRVPDVSRTILNLSRPNDNVRPAAVSEQGAEDLELRILARAFASNQAGETEIHGILVNLPMDPSSITYRQGLVSDLMRLPKLREDLKGFLPLGHELNYFSEIHKERSSPFLQAIWRLGELELYVDAVTYLGDTLERHAEAIDSKALRDLAVLVAARRTEPIFAAMERELPTLRAGLSMKKSVTIGVNLDQRLRPVEAGIISVNDYGIRERTLGSRLFGGAHQEMESTVSLMRMPSLDDVPGSAGSSFPLTPLFQDLEDILKSASKVLVRGLKSFSLVNASFLSDLRTELAVLIEASEVFTGLAGRGLPVCFPRILSADLRTITAREFYNPLLALRDQRTAAGSIVRNDIRLSPENGIQILTGPNRGGKTTYVQGVGLFQVLAQCGLPVTASEASVSPVDLIATHFPVQESGRLGTGRLGEEARRLSELFRRITRHSLVLMNESLTSTSPAESLYLALDIVKGLRLFGARAVYATHLHDLAEAAGSINEDVAGATAAVSVRAESVSGADGAERTYRIIEGPPEGVSHARDIAVSAGIDFPQLERLHQERKDQVP